MTDTFSLAGKTLLVTGSYSGIGEAFVRQAAAGGARLVLLGRRPDALDLQRGELPNEQTATHVCDIESIDGFKAELSAVAEAHGPFDGVFHTAGLELISSIRRLRDSDFEAVFSGSVFGAAAICAMAAKKAFLVEGGSVVLMSSVTSERPQNGMALYSASKAAVDALVKSAANELATRHVRVNSIVAGAVTTRMLENSLRTMPAPAAESYKAAHLLGFGSPDDVANAATYLLSNAAAWITGTGLVVDGGFLAR